ncbi:MAG TPA: glycine cleavage system aminomethyltransferase GcvT [Verrucomicrobiae bacterium]
MNSAELKRTPLYSAHQELGGKLIEFGGWEMPVQYTSIVDEHLSVRSAAGIFDISHMGEFLISGPGAEGFLNRCLTNDVRKLAVGQGQYTLMCNDHGGVIDDLYAYRLSETEYLLIVNASRIAPDFSWLERQLGRTAGLGRVALRNVSDQTGAVAVQGPQVALFIDECFGGPSIGGTRVAAASQLEKNRIGKWTFGGTEVWVSRTGYTGEDGFEVAAPAGVIGAVWKKFFEAGRPHGLKPAGLGARDTLRTEVCYPLYGHELDENTTPIEAGLVFFVSFDKGDFNGQAVLARQKAEGTNRKLVAFKMTERSAPPRPHYAIWNSGADSVRAGEVVSGTQSPSLGIGIGLGYLPAALAKPQTPIQIEIRGKLAPAVTVPKPIYRKPHN